MHRHAHPHSNRNSVRRGQMPWTDFKNVQDDLDLHCPQIPGCIFFLTLHGSYSQCLFRWTAINRSKHVTTRRLDRYKSKKKNKWISSLRRCSTVGVTPTPEQRWSDDIVVFLRQKKKQKNLAIFWFTGILLKGPSDYNLNVHVPCSGHSSSTFSLKLNGDFCSFERLYGGHG